MLIDDSDEVKDPGKELWMSYESWQKEKEWKEKREKEFLEWYRRSYAENMVEKEKIIDHDPREELLRLLNDTSKPVEYSITIHKSIWDKMLQAIVGPFKKKV